MEGPHHRGELAARSLAGLAEEAAISVRAIRDTVPPIAMGFLAEQRMIAVGVVDPRGRVQAGFLTGPEGFVHTPDPHTLTIAALPAPDDPLAVVLSGPAPVGLLAIEPETRRRMRMNGLARPDGHGGLVVELDQVFANCPKYIQKRAAPEGARAEPGPPSFRADALDAERAARIARADTFFIATTDDAGHVDVSHRGGDPGFVRVPSPTRLGWPDYTGNAMFLTLGNLLVDPRAGLVFPDFATGTALHLTGTATVDWDPAHAAAFPGARRLVDFTVTEVTELPGTLPAGWSPAIPSRFNPPVEQD